MTYCMLKLYNLAMPRMPRIVAPDYPHHVVQRGNRRQQVFFRDSDYEDYLRFLKEYSEKFQLKIVSYCLMPNHVHLIVIPQRHDSLASAIGDTHQKYTKMVNLRQDWRGYLWQGRFSSYVLDERYLYTVLKYIFLNPVKAGIVKKAEEYKWSSLRHHLERDGKYFLDDDIIIDMIADWKTLLYDDLSDLQIKLFRKHENTGRPLGEIKFIEKLEKLLGVSFKRKKPGPKTKIK